MNKPGRIMALVTAVVLVFSIFAGCGGKTEKASGKTTKETTSAASTGIEDKIDMTKKLKIEFCSWGQYPYKNDATFIKAMNEKYNIELNMWPCFGDEYKNQLYLKLAAGQIPDVIKISGEVDPVQLVKQDIIIEITEDFIKQNMPKYYEDLYKQSKEPFKYSIIDGKNYGLPGTSADGIYHFTVIWRSDWLNNVGVAKVPETIDEFEQVLYKFTNEDPDKNSKKDTYGLSNLGMLPVFGAFGPIPYNNDGTAEFYSVKDGKVVHNATQPEMKEALKLLNKWYKDGVIDPEFITGERTTGHWSSSQAFASGRIGYTSPGMYYNTGRLSEIGRDGKLYKLFRETQDGLGIKTSDYVHGRPPVGKDGKTSGTIMWGVEEGANFAFGKPLASDKEKMTRIAMWFDDLWMNIDNYMSAIYGKKGTDWTYDETAGDLQIGLGPETKIAKEKEDWASIGLGYPFIPDLATMMTKETPKYYGFAEKVARYSDGYVDSIGSAPLQTRSKYQAELIKKTLTAYSDMITGKKAVDTYFDEYVREWENAGGKEILTEADEWYAKNGARK